MEDSIKRYQAFLDNEKKAKELAKTRPIPKVKLGDMIYNANIDSSGRVIGNVKHTKDYRVIGLNPKVKLQEIIYIKGEQELGDIIEIEDNILTLLRPLNPLVNIITAWVGKF